METYLILECTINSNKQRDRTSFKKVRMVFDEPTARNEVLSFNNQYLGKGFPRPYRIYKKTSKK